MTKVYAQYTHSFEVVQDNRLTRETFSATVWENGDAEVVVRSSAGETVYTKRSSWSTPEMAQNWTHGAMIMLYA